MSAMQGSRRAETLEGDPAPTMDLYSGGLLAPAAMLPAIPVLNVDHDLLLAGRSRVTAARIGTYLPAISVQNLDAEGPGPSSTDNDDHRD
jgi:hypothetical protein